MKTKLACIPGLALLVTSLICGGSLACADALEAESSALLTFAPDADANGAESQDKLHCVLYSDGADNCIVNAQLPRGDQPSSSVDESEPPATEPAAAVQFFDAVAVVVTQSVTIAAPGLNAGDSEEPASAGSIPAPSAMEPVLSLDANIATGAFPAPAPGQSDDAIVVAIVQSATIAVPGQDRRDSMEAAPTEPSAGPTAPTSVLEAKTLDHAE